jgi:diaminohydroxyphosphoribosylaminopyrimidine deaminase / 5-amino-6-(5-phosphoribosylamino)uracil reductase
MASTDPDLAPMREALALAESAIGVTEPNPRVGCVLVRDDGLVIGRGATQQAGGPHAEVMALRDALAAGHPVSGATAYVTLEPCAHHGRTPPCCDALIAASLRRVVVALHDPFPQVAGAGTARMREAGIEVIELSSDWGADLAEAARELNIGFLSRMERGRPWVRLKVAASLDGRTALPDGRSQWITGPAARTDGHAWRRRASVVLTGIGTVLADDPRLDVRRVETVLQPLRVVVDSRWRIPGGARLLDPPGKALIVAACPNPEREAELAARGVQTCVLPGLAGRVDLSALLHALARDGANEVHVEGGAELNGALLQAGLVDELLLYQAAMLIGPGRPIAQTPPLPSLASATRFDVKSLALIGDDARIVARARPAHGEPGPD